MVGDRAHLAGQETALLDALEQALPDDAVVVADMCKAGYWYGGYGRVAQPRGLAYPVGWGTLGFGFPAALGAALSGRPTVALVGDGGFLFGCGDLATAAQERLPVTVVLVDDGGYGMLRQEELTAGIGAASDGGTGHVTFYIGAEDPQGTLAKVEANGGRVIMPLTEVAPETTIALFADPEGHVVGLM